MLSEQPSKQRYSLHIRRYDRYLTFESLEELRQEVGLYFTEREKAAGIVDRLTSFVMKNECPGYWTGEQKYQDMTATCDVFFPAFDDPSLQPEVSKQRKSLKELIGETKPTLANQILGAQSKADHAVGQSERTGRAGICGPVGR